MRPPLGHYLDNIWPQFTPFKKNKLWNPLLYVILSQKLKAILQNYVYTQITFNEVSKINLIKYYLHYDLFYFIFLIREFYINMNRLNYLYKIYLIFKILCMLDFHTSYSKIFNNYFLDFYYSKIITADT